VKLQHLHIEILNWTTTLLHIDNGLKWKYFKRVSV